MKNQKGFSLIELLIVVTIIGIIAAIAIPNLFSARRAANEASAISSLRTIHAAQITYQATKGAGNFSSLGNLVSSGIVQFDLSDSNTTKPKSGYKIEVTFQISSSTQNSSFGALATPIVTTGTFSTGYRDFVIFSQGVIYTGAAGQLTGLSAETVSGSSVALGV